MFKLTIISKDVSEWTEEGQGDYLSTIGVDDTILLPNELTLDNISKALSAYFNTPIYLDSSFITEYSGTFNVVEDGNGNPTLEGTYICDYSFMIDNIKPVNMSEALGKGKGE